MHIVTAGGRWGDGKHKGGFFMRILLLGNSFTSSHHLPQKLAALTDGQVVAHTRGGARLSEQLNPKTALGAHTQAALQHEKWDFVVLQEMSHGPLTTPERFFQSVKQLCEQIRANGATPVLFATWAYQKDSKKLAAKGWDYDEMARALSDAYSRAARANGAVCAGVGQQFYAKAGTVSLYDTDGVHPSEAGALLAAETLAAVIQTATKEKTRALSHNPPAPYRKEAKP